MNAWFGPDPWARLCENLPWNTTPVGEPCVWCDEPIAEGDSGIMMLDLYMGTARLRPWHSDCSMRSVVGGLHHQQGLCNCHGCSSELPPDPIGLSRREAAKVAVTYWRSNRQG